MICHTSLRYAGSETNLPRTATPRKQHRGYNSKCKLRTNLQCPHQNQTAYPFPLHPAIVFYTSACIQPTKRATYNHANSLIHQHSSSLLSVDHVNTCRSIAIGASSHNNSCSRMVADCISIVFVDIVIVHAVSPPPSRPQTSFDTGPRMLLGGVESSRTLRTRAM